MSQIFEALMVISFGISWPAGIVKSYTSRSAKGKSIIFLSFILFGYMCGIISKIASDKITYVLFFYILNFIMVFIDTLLYFRNKKLDKIREATQRNEKA